MIDRGFTAADIDTSRPHTARMYNYFLGGRDNYAADREAAAEVLRAAPEARDIARHNRAFLQRAVRYLAGDLGIRQIIDVGTGIVLADVRDPQAILAHPGVTGLIDFSQPVALLLIAIAHFLTDDEDPAAIIGTFRDALPGGSYLALSHATADLRPDVAANAAAVYDRATSTATLRSHAEISALFAGFELEEPGLVQVPLWRPTRRLPRNLDKIWIYGGVGRKPGAGGLIAGSGRTAR